MCYSALIKADWARYRRQYGAGLSLAEFHALFYRRTIEPAAVKLPKLLEAAFDDPRDDAERAIKSLIDDFRSAESTRLEQELFKQRKRLADAERSLLLKATKTASESRRIAGDKVEWIVGRLASLRSRELTLDDQRIFPGHWAPVIVWQDGRRVVRPMRYQCRPAGKPASHDRQFPGTYNARRDSLGGYWKGLFGRHHGVMLAGAFFEHVQRDAANVILEFSPRPAADMLVACLWSHWTAPGQPDLLSFAAITDEPPPEVRAAGHDRCIIPLRPENVDAWLQPDPRRLAEQQAILDDRERPYYEHRLAA